jgi:spermidine/putrescine-binding protein
MDGKSATGGRIDRREFHRVMAGLGLGLVAVSAFGRKAGAASNLVYFTWGGYDDPAFRQPYIAKYGDGPEFVFYGHTDEGFLKLQQGFRADVAHPCMHDVQKWRDAGLIEAIDPAKIAEWDNLIPALRDADGLMADGKHWLVPWEWGSSSIIYRTDKVTFDTESYALLTDERYKGRIAAPDAFDEIYQVAAVLAGVKHPLALEEPEYEPVQAQMRAIFTQLKFLWSDPTVVEQALASGELDLAWGWPNSFSNLRNQGLPVAYMLNPKEGIVTWLCGLARLKGGKASEEEVYDFINALLDPQSGKALIENFGYGHSNARSLEQVDKAKLAQLGMDGDVAQFLAAGNFLGAMPVDQRQRLIDMWESTKAGG